MMYSERVRIQVLLEQGWDVNSIALVLDMNRATVFREIGRYQIGNDKSPKRYDANIAQLKRVLEKNY